MDLPTLFEVLAASFDGPEDIEKQAKYSLRAADFATQTTYDVHPLTEPFTTVMSHPDAHPVCSVIGHLRKHLLIRFTSRIACRR